MLHKMNGDAAMNEMDADRQAYEDQAEYNATRPDRHIAIPAKASKTPLDSIPF